MKRETHPRPPWQRSRISQNAAATHPKYTQSFLVVGHECAALQSNKCKFYANNIDYLCQITHSRRLKLTSYPTDAIRGLPPTTDLSEKRSFCCLWNVSRRFVTSFVKGATPLKQRLIEDQLGFFTPLKSKDLHAIKVLKNALMSPPILTLPYFCGRLTIEKDAATSKLAVSLLKNIRTIHPNQSSITLVSPLTLKSFMTHPRPNSTWLYGPFSPFGHNLKATGSI